MADQAARDALVTDLDTTGDALAHALDARAEQVRRELAVRGALAAGVGAAAAADAAQADRTGQYIRGDGPAGRTRRPTLKRHHEGVRRGHPDLVPGTETCGSASLPVNPFVSNRYHFGMLLGVADLDTDQGYHRGKTWLHNAWLHGSGTVWGLGVEVTPANNEVVVLPGLAVDGSGRELHVADRLCVDLGRWYAERRPEDLEVTDDGRWRRHLRPCMCGSAPSSAWTGRCPP